MPAPTAFQWNALIRAYAICTLALLLKYFASVMLAADQEKAHLPEEGVVNNLIGNPKNFSEATRKRYKGVTNNDIECIPLHLVIFWAAYVLQTQANAQGNGSLETVALTCLVVIYTATRTLHSVCYYCGLQPWRTVSFLIATMSAWGAGALLVAAAFNIDTSKLYGAQ